MPPTPPQKKPDRHYDFRRTNVVFALSSLALLAISLLMVMMDFGRPWKRYQAEFRDLERASFVAKLEVERESLNNDSVATVQAETAAEQARLVERQGDIAYGCFHDCNTPRTAMAHALMLPSLPLRSSSWPMKRVA